MRRQRVSRAQLNRSRRSFKWKSSFIFKDECYCCQVAGDFPLKNRRASVKWETSLETSRNLSVLKRLIFKFSVNVIDVIEYFELREKQKVRKGTLLDGDRLWRIIGNTVRLGVNVIFSSFYLQYKELFRRIEISKSFK